MALPHPPFPAFAFWSGCSGPTYAEKTKPEIQAQHKAKLAENQASLDQIAGSIAKYMAAMSADQLEQYKKAKVRYSVHALAYLTNPQPRLYAFYFLC